MLAHVYRVVTSTPKTPLPSRYPSTKDCLLRIKKNPHPGFFFVMKRVRIEGYVMKSEANPLVIVHEDDEVQSDGMRIYASIAALNAAKPTQPAAAACGPALAPKIPPVMQPAAMPFLMSFFARSPSMQHSVPEKRAPTMPKFFADDHDREPISFKPRRSCSRHGRLESS